METTGNSMETVTLTATTVYTASGISGKLNQLWIGQDEVPVEDLSLSECLQDMQRQGWALVSASASPYQHGAFCTYKFKRPRVAQRV